MACSHFKQKAESSCIDISLFSEDELFINTLKEEAHSRGLTFHAEKDIEGYHDLLKKPHFQPKILLTSSLELIHAYKEHHPTSNSMVGMILHKKDMETKLKLIHEGVELFVDSDMSPYHIIEVCHLELSSRELTNFTILLYEAYYPFGKAVQKSLEEMTIHCELARHPKEIHSLSQKFNPKLTVLDLTQETQESGGAILKMLFEDSSSDHPYVVCIGSEQEVLLEQAFLLGIEDFIIRPMGLRVFVARLANIAQKVALMNVVKNVDPLTGLLGRSAFEKTFKQELARIEKEKQSSCLALIDLDSFKEINDSYGHSVGDQVLKEFAYFLKNFIGKNDLVGRWGGEEFIVLLHTCSLEEGHLLLEHCLENCRASTFIEQEKTHRLSFSCGLVPLDGTSKQLKEIFHSADSLLNQAKERGRNCVLSSFST